MAQFLLMLIDLVVSQLWGLLTILFADYVLSCFMYFVSIVDTVDREILTVRH